MYPSLCSWAGAVAMLIVGGAAAAAAPKIAAAAPATSAATERQPASFTLDLAAAASQDVTLTVRSPSRIPFKIIRGGAPVSGKAMLDVSPFINDQGVVQLFTVSVGQASGGADHVEDVPFDNPVLTATLNVPPDLPTGSKYTGRLILTVPGQAQPIVWRLLLTSAAELRPATLVLDRNAVTVNAIRPICLWPWPELFCLVGQPAIVTVHVRDKSGNWPLEAVKARLDSSPGTASTGIDQAKIVSTAFDGHDAGDIFAAPPPGLARDVAARGQGTIAIKFDNDIDVGEYAIPLRFTAANSGDDDLQRLAVTLKVRASIAGAILALLGAALLSFMATRFVAMLRQRASFLARVHAMRPAWLAREPQTLVVMGLRAVLRQAEDRSRRFWLTGQKEIEDRLAAAARTLAILDRIRQIRGRIAAISEEIVKQRASWKLDDFVDQLSEAPPTEQEATRINADLDRFGDWCGPDPDKQREAYWKTLEERIYHIQTCLSMEPLREPGADKLAKALLDELQSALKARPADLPGMARVDIVYRRLTLLWDARTHPDWVASIVELHPENAWKPIDHVYRVIDEGLWKIFADPKTTSCGVEGPSSLEPPEAYETVLFRLKTKAGTGEDLPASYLIRKKLTYVWTIKATTARGEKTYAPLASTQPQVATFASAKGKLTASVEIYYNGRPGRSAQLMVPIEIGKSSDFRAWRIAEGADWIAFAMALLVSVLSGIKLYALGATFGSLTDYLALFTWGAGVDQGKNFLQSLVTYSSTSSPTPAPTAPAPGAHGA